MRGSVIKKGNRWYVKIELDPDPLTGKRRPKWHSGFRTKKEAEKARIDLLSKFDRGEYVEPSQQTLADYLTDWLAAIEHTVRPSTFDSYKRNMHNHVIAHIGATKLARVDAGVLNGLYSLLLSSGRRRPSQTGRGYSPEIVDRAIELRAPRFRSPSRPPNLQTEFDEAATHQPEHAQLATPSPRATVDLPRSSRQASTGEPSATSTRSSIAHSRMRCAGVDSPAIRPMPPTHHEAARSPTASTHGTPRRFARSSKRHANRTTDYTRCGLCSPRPACDEAKRSAFDGATSTLTPAGCGWSRRSRKFEARWRSANRRRRRAAARSRSTMARSRSFERTAS